MNLIPSYLSFISYCEARHPYRLRKFERISPAQCYPSLPHHSLVLQIHLMSVSVQNVYFYYNGYDTVSIHVSDVMTSSMPTLTGSKVL